MQQFKGSDPSEILNEYKDQVRILKQQIAELEDAGKSKDAANKRCLQKLEFCNKDLEEALTKIKESNYIQCDEEQLHRVFINLIKNSIESISDTKSKNVDFKGKINIDIKDDSDYIYVAITDNGVGFDHVDKKKILTPYFTTKKNGTGLGLAVVTKIITDHNSQITFNSITKGAKVEITIPK